MTRGTLARKTVFAVLALAVAAVGIFALAPAASAQVRIEGECFFDPYGDEVCPGDEVRDPKTTVDAEILGRPGTPPGDPDSPLPFTGADVTLLLVTGMAFVGTGAVLVRRNRARRSDL